MTRALLLALVAACGTSGSHPPAEPKPAAPPAPPVIPQPTEPPPSAEVVHPASRAAIEAPHGGAISTLAVTPDGTAAITADQLGGMRLWPVLDGSREPLVVDLPHARDLAIGTRADG